MDQSLGVAHLFWRDLAGLAGDFGPCRVDDSMQDNGERNRGLYVLKSHGMAHSNQIREFVLSREG